MKKTLLLLATIITILLLMPICLYASNLLDIKIAVSKSDIIAGESIKLEFTAENIGIADGLSVMGGTLDYDRNKIDKIQDTDFTTGDGWEPMIYNPENGEFAIDRADGQGIKTNNTLFTLEIKTKKNASLGDLDIVLKDLVVVDDLKDAPLQDVKKTVRIIETEPDNGNTSSKSVDSTQIIIIIAVGIVIILIIAFLRGKSDNKKTKISKKNSLRK